MKTAFHFDEKRNMHVSWETSHTWEEWRDLHTYLDDRMHETLAEMPSFPQGHLLMTTLLVDDRLRGLNRWSDAKEYYTQVYPRNDETPQTDGQIRGQQVLQNCISYPQRALYLLKPEYEIGAVMCLKQTLYPKGTVGSSRERPFLGERRDHRRDRRAGVLRSHRTSAHRSFVLFDFAMIIVSLFPPNVFSNDS